MISGVAGQHSGVVIGVYCPTTEIVGGRVTYQKEGAEDQRLCLDLQKLRWYCCNLQKVCWLQQSTPRKVDHGWLMCSICRSDAQLPEHVTKWKVRVGKSTWKEQPVHVEAITRPPPAPLVISGVAGPHASTVSGVYLSTAEVIGGRVAFQKAGSADRWLCFNFQQMRWLQQSPKNKGEDVGLMCSNSPSQAQTPEHVQEWSVRVGKGTWEEQIVCVQRLDEQKCAKYRWYFLCVDHPEEAWSEFTPTAQREVESLYASHIKNPHDRGSRHRINIHKNVYELDFEAMLQRNVATNRVRGLKRAAVLDVDKMGSRIAQIRANEQNLALKLKAIVAEKAELQQDLDAERKRRRVAEDFAKKEMLSIECWRYGTCLAGSRPLQPALFDGTLLASAEAILRATAHSRPGSKCKPMESANVTRVQPIINHSLWKAYCSEKSDIRERHQRAKVNIHKLEPGIQPIIRGHLPWIQQFLDNDVNEVIAFHGTMPDKVNTIAEDGFDERLADSSGLYGMGTYFAEQSCKSFQYAGAGTERCILLVRLILGQPHRTAGQMPGMRVPPLLDPAAPTRGRFDSVVAEPGIRNGQAAGSQIHREFVMFNRRQAYPELAVFFTT